MTVAMEPTEVGSTDRRHILVVEDEPATREALAELLRGAGFTAECAATLREARASLSHRSPALVLLDLNLPDDDGLALARELAANAEIGCIIVTTRADGIDRVVGLELGADDYITKPFLPREVVARTRAVLRRMTPAAPVKAAPASAWVFGDWKLDAARRQLLHRCGSEVYLTRAEFDMLHQLVRASGRVLTRDQLLDATVPRNAAPYDRTVDVLIGRLRRKIEADAKSPKLILTVPGVGYKFSGAVTAS